MYLLAVFMAWISTWLSVAIYILVPVLYILPGRIDRYLLGRPSSSEARATLDKPVAPEG